jgi:nitronate monooxygenase
MDLRQKLQGRLRLPLIGSPLFIISVPDLVVAQCTSGVIGSMPTLNARPLEQLDDWLYEISGRLAEYDRANPDRPSAPFAMNLIVHRSNDRLEEDLKLVVKHRVPLIISSLGARTEVNDAIHSYGGHVLHDVINQTFAHKAIEKGADGLVLVASGAGGHAGAQSPFALMQETRAWFDGPIALSGSIAHGRSILAAEAMGADFAYMGSAFIATEEARAVDEYKTMLVESGAEDIVYTNLITGVHGNYLKPSVRNAGLDPDNSAMNFAQGRNKKWKDIWGAGQSVSGINEVLPAGELVARLHREYLEARRKLGGASPLVNPNWARLAQAA